jgi:site-specific DNA-methyltransferase (adenine-specific)
MKQIPMTSLSEHWRTPEALYRVLDDEFHFDFDPCPGGDNVEDGTAPMFCSWTGRRVFCNPPYGPKIRGFIERGVEADVAVFLIPSRTDTRWFHEIVLPFAKEIRFIKGRLTFAGGKSSAPFPSMVVVFEKGYEHGNQ